MIDLTQNIFILFLLYVVFYLCSKLVEYFKQKKIYYKFTHVHFMYGFRVYGWFDENDIPSSKWIIKDEFGTMIFISSTHFKNTLGYLPLYDEQNKKEHFNFSKVLTAYPFEAKIQDVKTLQSIKESCDKSSEIGLWFVEYEIRHYNQCTLTYITMMLPVVNAIVNIKTHFNIASKRSLNTDVNIICK